MTQVMVTFSSLRGKSFSLIRVSVENYMPHSIATCMDFCVTPLQPGQGTAAKQLHTHYRVGFGIWGLSYLYFTPMAVEGLRNNMISHSMGHSTFISIKYWSCCRCHILQYLVSS